MRQSEIVTDETEVWVADGQVDAPHRPPWYHVDGDCGALRSTRPPVKTTVALAESNGIGPCLWCVGLECPFCDERVTGPFGEHLAVAHDR